MKDTIARRFATAAIGAVVVTLLLLLAVNRISGTWSAQPLEESGLLHEVADMQRLIEASPPSLRIKLAAAATIDNKRVDWFASDSVTARALLDLDRHHTHRDKSHSEDEVRASLGRPAIIFSPEHSHDVPPGMADLIGENLPHWSVAVALNDGSWIAFTALSRSWGVSNSARWAIRLVALGISIALVTAFAARKFSEPIEKLAKAVREFGNNPQGPAIEETGPQELKQVIRTFNAMQAQIQAFVSHRTTMLAAISHDLRTPLTRIRLRGELIEDKEQQARLFRDVDEMQAMVDGALAFFRDDAVAEDATTLDLPHVLVTTANDYADQNIDIAYTGPQHGLYRGRPFALKRALTNLIENAIKYGSTPELGLVLAQGAWNITVSDRGPGIPIEHMDTVFRPYHRLDRSRNRTTGGVGLGLTVAQVIVQGHGGRIVLANRNGGGLEARIVLPIHPDTDIKAPN